MVARHTSKPFRVVCLTDQPDDIPEGVEPIEISPVDMRFERGWWKKVELFNPALPISGRILYLDLDVLVVGNLDPIIDFPADFAIAPDSAPNFQGRDQWKTIKGYQSSVMVFDHKARTQFYRAYSTEARDRLWGDQDLYKEVSPNEMTFPGEWFSRLTPEGPAKWTAETKVVLCVRSEYKNHKAAKLFPWFKNYWI